MKYQNIQDVVPVSEISGEDFNLNIRRYVDNSPELEPQDVKAHILGGVPKIEVDSRDELFEAHGFDKFVIFQDKNTNYYDFKDSIEEKGNIIELVLGYQGVAETEYSLIDTLKSWWKSNKSRIENLKDTKDTYKILSEYINSFHSSFNNQTMLDEHKIQGVLISWWHEA